MVEPDVGILVVVLQIHLFPVGLIASPFYHGRMPKPTQKKKQDSIRLQDRVTVETIIFHQRRIGDSSPGKTAQRMIAAFHHSGQPLVPLVTLNGGEAVSDVPEHRSEAQDCNSVVADGAFEAGPEPSGEMAPDGSDDAVAGVELVFETEVEIDPDLETETEPETETEMIDSQPTPPEVHLPDDHQSSGGAGEFPTGDGAADAGHPIPDDVSYEPMDEAGEVNEPVDVV